MKSLHPTVWRSCRVLANEIRLKMLWRLFQQRRASMGQLARWSGVAECTASAGLRALNARGLIQSERVGLYVYYVPRANPEVEHSELLLDALRECYNSVVPFEQIIHAVTAFTHPRRIDIVNALVDHSSEVHELSVRTQISVPALQRHLKKLVDRGVVVRNQGVVELAEPSDHLSGALLKASLGR